jgi:K+-sensing histidine kinase KdpD
VERLRQVFGLALCSGLAVSAAFLFHNTRFSTFVPLLFIGVIGFLANKFGTWSGILGTIAVATIFAEFLFEPSFSLHITNSAGKSNLVWMVIGGIALSDLLGVPPSDTTHNSSRPA